MHLSKAKQSRAHPQPPPLSALTLWATIPLPYTPGPGARQQGQLLQLEPPESLKLANPESAHPALACLSQGNNHNQGFVRIFLLPLPPDQPRGFPVRPCAVCHASCFYGTIIKTSALMTVTSAAVCLTILNKTSPRYF